MRVGHAVLLSFLGLVITNTTQDVLDTNTDVEDLGMSNKAFTAIAVGATFFVLLAFSVCLVIVCVKMRSE